MEKDHIENLEARRKLMEIINQKPGIHFREIFREANLAMGELEYHIDVLEKMEVITKKKNTYYTRYYPAFELATEDKKIMGLLRQEILRDMLLYIISTENPGHSDIAHEFHLIKSTASFYIDKLIQSNLLEKKKIGRKVIYNIKEPERILRLILIYRKGFGDEIVKRVEGLWGNL